MYRMPLILFLLLARLARGQFYNQTSEPFVLAVISEDGSINDTLSTCHTGAALESLCLSNSNSRSKSQPEAAAVFHFNTSSSSSSSLPLAPGILAWTLPSKPPIPSSVRFDYDPTTNIAFPMLYPGSEQPQILAFVQQDYLVVQGYIDWSTNPPNATAGEASYSRWYACNTYISGYQYQTLTWALGPGKPEPPSCVSVRVKRMCI